MPKIKNMGHSTARFNEGIIVSGSANNNESLIISGSAILVGNLHISGSDQEGIRIGKGGSEYRQIVFETDGDDGAIIQLTNAEHLAIFAEENKDTIFYSKESGDGSYLERARIKNTGKVGIGKSDPSYKLHVYDDVSDYVAIIDNDQGSSGHGLKVTSDGTGAGTYLFDIESASTTLFRVRGDGRVGIGKVTSLPAAVLTVSSSNTDSDLAIAHKIHHIGDSDTYIQFEDDAITVAAGGRNFIKIEEANTDKLTINNGGLDIDLKVSGENQANLIRTDAANDSVYFGVNGATGTDNNFFVSGSKGSKGSGVRGTAVFGGDLVISGTLHTSVFEFPVSDGSNNQVIKTDGNGNLSFVDQSGGGSGDNLSLTAPKTSNYTASNWEMVLVNLIGASGDVTVTLPAASSDKQIAIKIAGAAMGKKVTVDGNGSETIDGEANKILDSDYESMHIISDGSNWWRIS